MNKYFNKKKKIVKKDEFKKHLDFCNKERIIFEEEPEKIGETFAWLNISKTKIELTYSINNKPCTYILYRDERNNYHTITGLDAYRILSQYYKIPKIKLETFSAIPLLWYNKKYSGTRNYAYGYDLNSAYAASMCETMPDTSVEPIMFEIVKKGYIGFDCEGNCLEEGELAEYQFPEIESPFKKFVNNYYNKKKKAIDLDEKQKFKDVLNFSVGYMQLKNPFLRARIIFLCNKKIESLIDENTLLCNTDSLVSLTRRKDIEEKLGNELGEWKLEHEGQFAYKGLNYQWNSNVCYRGVPKSWFKENFDILIDELPRKPMDYIEIEYNNKLEKYEISGGYNEEKN